MSHKNIRIEFIDKDALRYETGGDWFIDEQGLCIQISNDVGSEAEQFLFALHELVEWRLCASRGISQKTVDDFDLTYQGEGEPGDNEAAPYRAEHRQAMLIEHLMANFLGLVDYGKVE